MRRKEREVTSKQDIIAILDRMDTLRIAFGGYPVPYIVPVSFGYTWEDGGDLIFYFHGAAEGRKARIITMGGQKGVPVAFELDRLEHYKGETEGCSYTALYESIIGEGVLRELTGRDDKRAAFDLIMGHCVGDGPWEYPDKALDGTLVAALTVSAFSAKKNG